LTEFLAVGPDNGPAPQGRKPLVRVVQGVEHALTWLRKRSALFHHTLANFVRITAFFLDVTPARISDAVDSSQHRLKVARYAVQGELASEAQLVIVGLHTLQQPPFAAGDVATEIL
jgi:hypothetical protein